LSINKDLTQPILDYIAHQPVNPGPIEWGTQGSPAGHIGHEGARRIIENGGSERDAYIQRFQEENPRYQVQSINSSKATADLSSQFESASATIRAKSDVVHHHTQNTANVLGQGKGAGLASNTTPKSIQKEVSTFIDNTDEKRIDGKVEIDIKGTEIQTAEKTSKNKHLTGTVIKNTAVNLFDHSGDGKSLPVDKTPYIQR
jgi:hypothetical protein